MTLIFQRRIVVSALLASCLVMPAIACSTGEGDGPAVDEGPADGTAPDAPPSRTDEQDASADALDASTEDAGDAQPRACSAGDVCHTTLPAKSFLRDVWSAGDGVVWAVGWSDKQLIASPGPLLRWDGKVWTTAFTSEARLNAVWGSSATDIWVGGDAGLFHGTGPSSSAITWKKVRSEAVASIWGSSANDVWAVGGTKTYQYLFDGKVLHYQGPSADGGDGWQIDPLSSRPASYRKVWGTSASDVWIGGAEHATCGFPSCEGTRAFAVRRRPDGDGGITWSEAGLPQFGGIALGSGIHRGSELSGGGSIGTDSVWLMGSKSPTTFPDPVYDVLFTGKAKTDGSGDHTWSSGTFGTCLGFDCSDLWFSRAVWGKSSNDVYLAGDFGQLRHWDGTSFSLVKTTIEKIPVTASFFGMWGSSSTDLWIVGDEIALHKVSPTKP